MKDNWIKQLSKTYIQLNEAKAYINTDEKSVRQSLKRDDVHVAAEAALGNPKHWIHQPKHAEIKTALTNFKNKNTQQEDLRHLVNFMKMDPKYTEFEVQQAFDK
jgi:hypothetical protein